jgi:uncharacterized SAM-binding protein YcdF (DUF218 family)
MFFLLSKLLAFALSPYTWDFGLFVTSFLSKNEIIARRLRILAFSMLYLCSNSFLIDECFRLWEPVTPDHDLMQTHYKGAVVLGGIGDVDLRLKKLNFSYGADRLLQVLPLYHNGRVEKIVFTGGSGSVEFPEKREGLYVQKYLRSIDMPDSALIIESQSKNTYENAINTKKILDSLNMSGPMLLVTSAYHMPRALAVFKKAGFTNLTPYITNKSSGVRRYTFDHLFLPNPAAAMKFDELVHEMAGYIIYKIRGYA